MEIMAKVKVGDIVLCRCLRLGNGKDSYSAKVLKVDEVAGIVVLTPWGSRSPWAKGGALPMVVTTSLKNLSPVWTVMLGESEEKLRESRYDYEDDIPTVIDEES